MRTKSSSRTNNKKRKHKYATLHIINTLIADSKVIKKELNTVSYAHLKMRMLGIKIYFTNIDSRKGRSFENPPM